MAWHQLFGLLKRKVLSFLDRKNIFIQTLPPFFRTATEGLQSNNTQRRWQFSMGFFSQFIMNRETDIRSVQTGER